MPRNGFNVPQLSPNMGEIVEIGCITLSICFPFHLGIVP